MHAFPNDPNDRLPWTPRVTVAAVIEAAGQFLMVQEEARGVPCFNQPAGHLEDGESLLGAVVRETLEETARHFRPEALVGIYRWCHPQGETYLRFTFCGTAGAQDTSRQVDPDIQRVLWMGRDELVAHRTSLRSPLVLRCVDDYLAGRRYPLDLLHDVADP